MTTQHATFAAGCFWGVEEDFSQIPGVLSTEVGYTGGNTVNPTYEQVCHTDTGHAEAVHLTFDDSKISFAALVDAFLEMHDPTTLNRQGPDFGSQYRSAIFVHSAQQETEARKLIAAWNKKHGQKAVTHVASAGPFYRAEEYHQRYLQKKRNSKRFGLF